MDNIMNKDPSTYVTDRGKIPFFRKYFYLEGPSSKGKIMTADRYISIMERLISIRINRASFKKTKRKKNKLKKTKPKKNKPKKTKRQRR